MFPVWSASSRNKSGRLQRQKAASVARRQTLAVASPMLDRSDGPVKRSARRKSHDAARPLATVSDRRSIPMAIRRRQQHSCVCLRVVGGGPSPSDE